MSKSQADQLRDEIFTLTGIGVVQLQLLEYYIAGCMAFVWKDRAPEIMSALLSTNAKRRGATIGRMLSVLQKTIRLEPNLENRLFTFVDNRNRLIHHLFQNLARFGALPPQDELEKTKRFIMELIQETLRLQKVFLGFFSAIGKKLKETDKENKYELDSEWVECLSKYETEFYSAFGYVPPKPDGV